MDMNMMKDILCDIGSVKVKGQKSDTEGPRLVNLCPKDKEYVIFLIRELITQVETNFALNRTVSHLRKERTKFHLLDCGTDPGKQVDSYPSLEKKLHKNIYGKDSDELYGLGQSENQALENAEWVLKRDRVKHKEEMEKLNNSYLKEVEMFRNKIEGLEFKLAEETKKNNSLVTKVSSLIERKDCLKKELMNQSGKSPVGEDDWRYMNDELRDLRADKKELEERLGEVIAEKESLLKRVENMRVNVELLKNDGVQLKRELAIVGTERQSDRRQLELKINNLIEAKKEIEELKVRLVKEKEIMSKQLHSKTNCLMSARNEVSEVKARLNKEKDVMSNQRKAYEEKIYHLKTENNLLESEISKIKNKSEENHALLLRINELKKSKNEVDDFVVEESKEKELRLSQIKNYEEKFNKLRNEVKMCNEQLSRVQTDYVNETRALKKEVRTLREAKEKLRENLVIEKDSVIDQLNAIETEHADRDSRIRAEHEEDLQELRDEINRLKDGNSRFEKELKEIDEIESKERFKLISKLKSYEDKEKTMLEEKERFERVDEEICRSRAEYSKLEYQYQEERKENENLRGYVNQLEGKVAALSKDLTDQNEKLSTSTVQHQSEKQSLHSILGELKRAKKVIENELTQNLLEVSEEKKSLSNQLNAYETREAALRHELADRKMKEDQVTRAYESECQKLEAELVELRRVRAELEKMVAKGSEELKAKVDELEKSEVGLRRALSSQNTAIGKLSATYESEARELKREIEKLASDGTRDKNQIRILEESENRLKGELAEQVVKTAELKAGKDFDNHLRQMEIYNLGQAKKIAEEKLGENVDEVRRLSAQVKKLEEKESVNVTKVQNLAFDVKKLEEKHKAHVSELTYEYQREWSALHSEVAALRRTNQELGERVIERSRERDKLDSQVRSLEDKTTDLSRETKEYNENVARLRAERDEFQTEMDGLRHENAELENRLRCFNLESKELNDKICAVMTVRDNECHNHRQEVNELRQTKVRLEGDVAELKRALAEIDERKTDVMSEHESERAGLQSKIYELLSVKKRLEDLANSLSREVGELKERISGVVAEKGDEQIRFQSKIYEFQEAKKSLEDNMTALICDNNGLKDALVNERVKYQSKIFELQTTKKHFEDTADDLTKGLKDRENEILNIHSRVNELLSIKSQLEEKIKNLNLELSAHDKKRCGLQSNVNEMFGVNLQLEKTVGDLNKSLKDHSEKIALLETDLTEVKQSKEVAERALASAELEENEEKTFLRSRLRTLEDILCLVLRENIVIYAEKREITAHAAQLIDRCTEAAKNVERLEADLGRAGADLGRAGVDLGRAGVLKRSGSVDQTTQTKKSDGNVNLSLQESSFPILRPSSYRMYLRTMRMKSERDSLRAEDRSRQLEPGRAAFTLVGRVGRTFLPETAVRETKDMYAVDATGQQVRANRFGINENDREYAESKWCYDTPGTVQPDQVINMLTTEELMRTLPKKLLHPRSFSLTPGKTIFVAGLGRLDYLTGDKAIRFTVLASAGLPLTVCRTSDADRLYAALLGSELLAVPCGGPDRLAQWPSLVASAGTIRLTGEDWRRSCADVVLSSAGWIAVTPGPEMVVELRAWTPDGRGVYVRPPLLRYAVNYRGPRITRSPAYKPGIGLYRRAP